MSELNFDFVLKRRDSTSDAPDLVEYNQVTETICEYSGMAKTRIPFGALATEIPIGLIAAGTFLFIESDRDVEVYLGDPLTTDSIKTNRIILFVTTTNAFTEVHIKNNLGASEVATISYFIGGDET